MFRLLQEVNVVAQRTKINPISIQFYSNRNNCRRDESEKPEEPLTLWEQIFGRKKKKTCAPEVKEHVRDYEFEKIPDFVKSMTQPCCGAETVIDPSEIKTTSVPVRCKDKTREEQSVANVSELKYHRQLEDKDNPMPHFTTVGQRLIDLQDRKLHPLYKKYEMPARPLKRWHVLNESQIPQFTSRSVNPKRLKNLNVEPSKKDLFWDYKMTETPKLKVNVYETPLEVLPKEKKECKVKGCPPALLMCPEKGCDEDDNSKQ